MSTYEAIRYNFSGANVTALNGSNISTGTIADARVSASSVNQHVDLTSLNASNLTSGTIPNARYGTPTFNGSNLTSLPSSAPTTSQVLTANAGASGGNVGTYAMVYYWNSMTNHTIGTNVSGSNMIYAAVATHSGTPSGTWKIMGYQQGGSIGNATSIGMRVS
tara:strand:- start:507 stop:995 length:489 start_codon:yes stop_codon:yes gene_type:complete